MDPEKNGRLAKPEDVKAAGEDSPAAITTDNADSIFIEDGAKALFD